MAIADYPYAVKIKHSGEWDIVDKWLIENCQDEYFLNYAKPAVRYNTAGVAYIHTDEEVVMKFMGPKDAVLFKMRWG